MSAIALVLRDHGPHCLGIGPEGFAGGRAPPVPWHRGRCGASPGARRRGRRTHLLARGAARERRTGRGAGRGIRIALRSEMLAAICATRSCLAVAGTHGKTTTASMLSLVLVEAGLRPSFVIGADVNEIGTNAVWDSGEWLVVEADESYGTFQAISPDLAVLTNVEPDHLDYYGTFDALRTAFSTFLAPAGRGAVVCSDDPEAAAIGREHGAITVGTAPGSTYVIDDLDVQRSSVSFTLRGPEGELGIAAHRSPGPAQRQECRRGRGGGARGRRTLRGGAGRPGPLRRRDPPLRVPRRGAWRHLRGRLRPPPDRGTGRPGDGAERGLVTRRGGVPAAPLLAHRRVGDAVRDGVRRRRRAGGDRRLQRRRAARPRGLGPPGGRRGAGRRTRGCPSPTRRGGRSCARPWVLRSNRAISASPWGRGT